MTSTFAEVIAETVEISEASGHDPVFTRRIRWWISEGKLPAWKVGGRLRIRLSDLDRLVERV